MNWSDVECQILLRSVRAERKGRTSWSDIRTRRRNIGRAPQLRTNTDSVGRRELIYISVQVLGEIHLLFRPQAWAVTTE